MGNLSQFIKSRTNLYLVLDILPGVSHGEILHAYNRAKITYSGMSVASYTLVDNDQGKSILDEIEDAYAILGNPSRRREYDLAMGYDTWNEETSSSELRPRGPSIVTKESQKAEDRESVPDLVFDTTLKEFNKTQVKVEKGPEKTVPAYLKHKVDSNAPMAEVVHLSAAGQGQFEPNPEFEARIQQTTDPDGAFFRALRLYRKMSPDQLATQCKLSAHHIQAIEEEDASRIPHAVYLRGHVQMISHVLGLPDPDKAARSFVERMKAQKKVPRVDLKS